MNNKFKSVALGADFEEDFAEVEAMPAQPKGIEERVQYVEEQTILLTSSLDSMFAMVKELRDHVRGEGDKKRTEMIEQNQATGKHEIPEGTILTGSTRGISYYLEVRADGFYVGVTRYETLSAAAKGVSGVRRSGWAFWHLPDGRSVKEVFRK
jgi:hypothetical protein